MSLFGVAVAVSRVHCRSFTLYVAHAIASNKVNFQQEHRTNWYECIIVSAWSCRCGMEGKPGSHTHNSMAFKSLKCIFGRLCYGWWFVPRHLCPPNIKLHSITTPNKIEKNRRDHTQMCQQKKAYIYRMSAVAVHIFMIVVPSKGSLCAFRGNARNSY